MAPAAWPAPARPGGAPARSAGKISYGMRTHAWIMVGTLFLPASVYSSACAVAETADTVEPAEEVALLSALVMLFFLLIAALVVISFVCKIIISFAFLPNPRTSRIGRVILFLANATGELRVVSTERKTGGGPRSSGGGGSSGGAGASGDFG